MPTEAGLFAELFKQGVGYVLAGLFAYLWRKTDDKLQAALEAQATKAEEDAKFYRDLAQKAGANV